ncbi:MAG: hypothetical protein FJ265_07715 [Planctomycetes bacterium]|nr:hypothetical protein [Planctomycetota bacterium]
MDALEDERLEFKEAKNRFDFTELLHLLCALANEGGGRVLLGVTDKRPRRVVGLARIAPAQLLRDAGLLDGKRPPPAARELETGTKVLRPNRSAPSRTRAPRSRRPTAARAGGLHRRWRGNRPGPRTGPSPPRTASIPRRQGRRRAAAREVPIRAATRSSGPCRGPTRPRGTPPARPACARRRSAAPACDRRRPPSGAAAAGTAAGCSCPSCPRRTAP